MDETRKAFEQWWGSISRFAKNPYALAEKEGAWEAWLYLTGQATLAAQQERAFRWNPQESRMEPRDFIADQGMKK